jgi:hypothetical protein
MLAKLWYSFPVQLLVLHAKKNQWLLLYWLVLFGFVTGLFGSIFGIPYLFVDPEYNHRISFTGLFIMGVAIGGFTMAFHITCYILDAHRFSFLGNEKAPFIKFCINNHVLPLLFLLTYLIRFIRFQGANEFAERWSILWQAGGFVLGFICTVTVLFLYFTKTNKDIFNVLTTGVNKPFQRKQRINRVNVMKKVDQVRQNRIRVDYFITEGMGIQKAQGQLLDLHAALSVLKQNHQNAFIIQCFVFVAVIVLGIFRDRPGFQIPAAASIILLCTLIVLFAGALTFWLRRWSITAFVGVMLFWNFCIKNGLTQSNYAAFGLNYHTDKAEYSLEKIRELSSPANYQADTDSTKAILERWKAKFPIGTKPKLTLICASGGGLRAAVWTMRSLQVTDSLLKGNLMKHTFLITGASGGLVGASYFRELYLRRHSDSLLRIYNNRYLENMGRDNLNAIAFSLVVSDLLFKFQKFDYNGYAYYKDRGYAFEQQLNKNTEFVMEKSLQAYREPERLARIPMLLMAPTIINDGRKLYISPQHVSYMTAPVLEGNYFTQAKTKGIEFLRFFEKQDAAQLRFLSALRMSATFPYITPNVTLPSQPAMEIMDAGLSDNFGITDAVRFIYVFKDWIEANTSGVVLLSIRDTPKEHAIEKNTDQSLLDKIVTPIGSLYQNWANWQDINNDSSVEFAQSWLQVPLNRIEIKYTTQLSTLAEAVPLTQATTDSTALQKLGRASLSWRLTEKEKASLWFTIFSPDNQQAISYLNDLLQEK